MKHEPISSHEKPSIIQHLALRGSWQGRRKGTFVRIVRLHTQALHSHVEFYVGIKPLCHNGKAATVAEAIDEINKLILSRDPQKEAEDALSRGETHL